MKITSNRKLVVSPVGGAPQLIRARIKLDHMLRHVILCREHGLQIPNVENGRETHKKCSQYRSYGPLVALVDLLTRQSQP